jgi:hypothetical protein
MAQLQTIPDGAAKDLAAHWIDEMNELSRAGNVARLRVLETSYALSTAKLLADGGSVLAASIFADLSQHATNQIEELNREPRELRRPVHVTEQLSGADV